MLTYQLLTFSPIFASLVTSSVQRSAARKEEAMAKEKFLFNISVSGELTGSEWECREFLRALREFLCYPGVRTSSSEIRTTKKLARSRKRGK